MFTTSLWEGLLRYLCRYRVNYASPRGLGNITHVRQGERCEARAEDALLCGWVVGEGITDGAEYEGRDESQKQVACIAVISCNIRSSWYMILDTQFPSCHMAIVVRASRDAAGAVPSGMSSWWNQAAPGCHHAIIAGITVDTTSFEVSPRCGFRTLQTMGLTRLYVQEEQLVKPRQGREITEQWHFCEHVSVINQR